MEGGVKVYAYRHYLLKGQIFAFDSRGQNKKAISKKVSMQK